MVYSNDTDAHAHSRKKKERGPIAEVMAGGFDADKGYNTGDHETESRKRIKRMIWAAS